MKKTIKCVLKIVFYPLIRMNRVIQSAPISSGEAGLVGFADFTDCTK